MSQGKYLSLEEARKTGALDRFAGKAARQDQAHQTKRNLKMTRHHIILMIVAFGGFCAAFALDNWNVVRTLEGLFRREENIDSVEEWTKRARQDIAGILVASSVTNGLLGAILAVLIFR